MFFPAADTIAFAEGGVESMRIDSSGNMGLGVTPSAWRSIIKPIQIGAAGALWSFTDRNLTVVSNNVYQNSAAADTYLNNGTAQRYSQDTTGQHVWLNAPSGTAGNAITFTQAMTLDASGNLGIGTTAPRSQLDVYKATTGGNIRISSNTDSAYGELIFSSNNATYSAYGASISSFGDGGGVDSGNLMFNTGQGSVRATKMTLTGTGNLGIGTSSPSRKLSVYDTSNIPVRIETNTADTKIEILTTSGTQFIQGSANNLLFGTNNTERMRIDSSGYLFVNRTSNTGTASQVALSYNANAGTRGIGIQATVQQDGTAIQFLNNSGTVCGSIAQSTSSVAYNTSSDYRLKENVAPMTGALGIVQQLKPVTYKWKVDGSNGQGFIAHELAEVVPDCVTGAKDAVETVDDLDAEGNKIGTKEVPSYQGIDTSFLVATLTAAIQEQQAMIEELKAEVAALKAA
jgi:hypothetical protein